MTKYYKILVKDLEKEYKEIDTLTSLQKGINLLESLEIITEWEHMTLTDTIRSKKQEMEKRNEEMYIKYLKARKEVNNND